MWETILSLEYSNNVIFVIGTNAIAFFSYWIPALGFLYLDLYSSDAFLQKYKVQKIKTRISSQQVWQTISQVLLNQLCITLPLSFIFSTFFSFDRELPSLLTILTHLSIIIFCEEIGFYYLHRLVHHPLIYKVYNCYSYTYLGDPQRSPPTY
jgi:sterol desaturase/sphingolipid hydroxylase (fatty acid hydroxylase superfamily)